MSWKIVSKRGVTRGQRCEQGSDLWFDFMIIVFWKFPYCVVSSFPQASQIKRQNIWSYSSLTLPWFFDHLMNQLQYSINNTLTF